MKHAVIVLLLAIPTLLPAEVEAASMEDRTMRYECGDMVVVGRVQSANYEGLGNPDDFPGRGVITATVSVRKTIKGHSLPKEMRFTYVAHSYMRSDRDFMIVLRKMDDGSITMTAAQLMSANPKIAARCD